MDIIQFNTIQYIFVLHVTIFIQIFDNAVVYHRMLDRHCSGASCAGNFKYFPPKGHMLKMFKNSKQIISSVCYRAVLHDQKTIKPQLPDNNFNSHTRL